MSRRRLFINIIFLTASFTLTCAQTTKSMEEGRKEAEKSGAKEREEVGRIKFCPFKSGMGNNCSPRYCALYVSGACALSMIGKSPAVETKGRYCPFTRGKYACNVQCALYEGGCRITAMIGEREENFV